MRKILSFVAAFFFAAYIVADPVILPAVLDVSNVSFRSEGMPDFVIEAGQDYAGTYFDMGAHDSSNDTLLYAEWDVTIQPIKYNLAVDVYNTNGWSVQLHLLNLDGDTVKALRYKGHSGEKGQFAIGSLNLSDLAAGNYKLRARAATAWSAMKLKDVIFEADYQGVLVDLPGTLLPAYALLSSGASVTNDAIAFAPSTANAEYALWNVSFAAAGSFNVGIDMTATNGHTYGVTLLSEDGETSIGSVAEAQSWDTGVKELGAIEVPAAGDYKVKLTNATQWSEAVLNSITFAAPEPVEPQMKTIYCKMDKAWWKADGAAVGIYAWDGDVKNANWPGERMTPVEGEDGLWSIELDINAYKNCIFTRVNGTGDIQDWGAKSGNLTIPTDDNDLYTITSETAVWGDPGVAGEWSVYTPAEPTPEPVVVYNWAKDAADQIGTTIMGGNSNISIGTVKIHENTDDVDGIKFGSSYVYADGKWIAIKPAEGGFKAGDTIYTSVVFNNSDLTKYCMVDIYAADTQTRLFRSDSASTLNGRNAGEPIVQSYVLESDQDSLLLGRYGNTGMFVTLLTVVRPDAAPEPTHTYTVAGAPASVFGTEWAPANTANDMKEVEAGIYLFLKDSVALAAGEVTFKVVEDHSWDNQAWPADDYVLKIDSNGIYHIAIYFNAVTKEISAAADKIGDAEFGEAKYYVAGSMNGWKADAAYELVANPAQEGEYMGQFTFKNGDAFKVIKDNATGSYTWYPGGNDNNYNITQDGIYNVYFRPEGNVEGWYEGYFHVMMQNDPVVKDTVVISASEGLDWIDVVEKQGWWQIYGKNEAYSFSLSCISTTEVAGIYPVDNLDQSYSYVHPLNGTDTIRFVSGAVAVATDDTAYVAVVGELVGEDGKIYAFNLVYLLANEVYKYDEKEADFAYDFESYQSSIQNGVAIVQAQAGNESMIVLAIILPQGQSALAAGEYQVVTTPAYGTVVAGSYTDNGFMPSFAATLVEQGGQLYYNKVWYLVSGTVTIDANLNIAVDALNSASKTIKANIQAPSEGIDAVGAEKKASKSIKNGQLIIERNGVEYNATGAVIR